MQTEPLYQRIYDYLLKEITLSRLKPGTKAPTEKELCQQFGVSRITSKRALEMLAANGYISRFRGKGSFIMNEAGTRMVPRGSGLIGFLIPGYSDFFGNILISETERNCTVLGYHLVLKHTRNSVVEESAAIKALAELNVAGILLMPVHGEYYNTDILQLALKKKPLVFVDRKMRGLMAPSVSTDNIRGAETGTEYLLRMGHRKIAFYSGPVKDVTTLEDRRQGFINAMLRAGVVPDPALFCCEFNTWQYSAIDDVPFAKYIAILKAHLIDHPEISAALVSEYPLALLVKEAANQLGRAIPGDLSVLCFDGPSGVLPLSSFIHLRQDEKALAQLAVDALHKLITGEKPAPYGDITVPARFMADSTTARVELPVWQ
ncbi:MAG: GntR family transcriptional regulator [Spirochaetaceae bacterium]|nr:GntR family transcriptional regulator [Spirochaetaceae bacterium]